MYNIAAVTLRYRFATQFDFNLVRRVFLSNRKFAKRAENTSVVCVCIRNLSRPTCELRAVEPH